MQAKIYQNKADVDKEKENETRRKVKKYKLNL